MLGDIATWATELVRDNQGWAAPICFGLAFAESLAFISLLVPSSVLLVAIGALVPISELSFGEVLAGTAVGAGFGDWLSYAIGSRFKHRIAQVWPFTRHPELLDKAHRFIARWGMLGVFGGRFLGPLRATVPLAAGTCAMPPLAFQASNWTSALVWAFVLLAPGAFGVGWFQRWYG